MKSPLPDPEENDSTDRIEENPLDDGLQASISSQPAVVEQQEIVAPSLADDAVENNEHEQQIIHDWDDFHLLLCSYVVQRES